MHGGKRDNRYLCSMEDKRNEQRRQWFQNHSDLQPRWSMKRRKAGHDYRSRCFYMVTLVVEDRKPVLGELCAPDDKHPKAWLHPSELGFRILDCWREIRDYYPQIQLVAVQLMPDHMHGVLFVKEPMPQHLGRIINGFKHGCNQVSRDLLGCLLWEEGYHDRILMGRKQLVKMVRYLHDNPHRLWIKRNHPDLFRVQHEVSIGGRVVSMAGNRFLLDAPSKAAVRCSRSLNEDDIKKEVNRFLSQAARGTVLVSPCISPGEKAVMRAAFNEGMKTIVVLENGFSPMWKPGGAQFDACADGRLLLVAPWPYHSDHRTITRDQCNQLNDLAAAIAAMET